MIVTNDKYDGYCTRCFRQLFPNDSRTLQIRRKTKEDAVKEFINLNFIILEHTNDDLI